MRILLFFLYVALSILGAYLDGQLFFGIHLIFILIFITYFVFYTKTSIEKEAITTSLVFFIILFSVSSALFFALLNHKTEFIGSYNTFYNLNLLKVLIICFLYPILEELVFRSFWLKYLNEKMSLTKSLILSAVGFSLSHFYSDIALIYPFISGLFLGWLYLKFKNIYLCIIFHIVYNISIITINTMIETTNFVIWKNYVMIVSFVTLILLFRILYIKQKNNRLHQTSHDFEDE